MTNHNNDKNLFIFLVTSIAALGGLLFGYDTGVIAGVMIFLKKEYHMSTFQQSTVVSVVLLGAAVGALVSGKLVDLYGRRKLMLLASAAFTIGTLLSALSKDINWIIFGRSIIGFAIGIASYAAPLYISEIAPTNKRGALVIINTIAVTGGIVVAYLIDLWFSDTAGWRWMFGLGIIPAVLLGIGVIFLPESPRWLAKHGLMDKAARILARVHPSDQIANELQEIQYNIEHERKANWKALFAPHVRILLVLGIGLAIIQQISGINTILYYAPYIFQLTGFSTTTSQLLATLGMGMTNFVFTIVAMIWVDKLGRRSLLLIGLGIMTVCMTITAILIYGQMHTALLTWVSTISLVIFVAAYALSIGCLFWLIISEIFPLHIRGVAMSIAAMTNWIANLIIALSFLPLLNAVGPGGTFFLYAVASFLSWLFCYFLVPETRKVSLEEIENNLRKGKPAREIGRPLHPLKMK